MPDIVYSLAASPQVAFAARSSGLICTLDRGKSWQRVFATPGAENPIPATAVVLSPQFSDDRTVFAAVPGGVLRSIDGGGTWEIAELPAPAPYITALAFSVTYAQDRALFAASLEDGVFRSIDAGASWNSWNFGLLDYQALSLAVSPAGTLYAGTGTGLFSSRNMGRAWSEIQLPCGHFPILSIACINTLLLAGTEGAGLYISPDEGQTWQRLGEAVLETVNALIVDGEVFLALASDAIYLSNNRGRTWQSVLGAENENPVAVAVAGRLGEEKSVFLGFDNGKVMLFSLNARS